MPKKRAPKSLVSSAREPLSKAAFVRSFPAVTPAKEVVARGKALGITLTEAYVYNVRATSRAKKKSGKRVRSGAPAKRTVKVRGQRAAEERLKAAAAELGFRRAIEVLRASIGAVRKTLED